MNKPIKVIFAGTPEFAVPFLEGFFSDSDFEVLGVITQPDKPTGRKQILTPPPIKLVAEKKQIKIWQPPKLRADANIIEEIKATGADIMAVVAYGQILPKELLDLFPAGAFNVHPSLLPKYRGASPIQNAILNGEAKTGISIMLMDELMDHGPIIKQVEITINGDETNESLHRDLAISGVPLLLSTIKSYLDGEIKAQPQDDSQATFCKLIATTDAKIDWTKTATEIKNQINAFYPWPATWTTLDGKRLKIYPPITVSANNTATAPGAVSIIDKEFLVQCGEGSIIVKQLQPEGKNIMEAKNLANGWQDKTNKILI